MNLRFFVTTVLALASLFGSSATAASPKTADKPLRVLVITGGCCHDYDTQTLMLKGAVDSVADARWTVVNEGGKGTRAQIPLYEKTDWAKGYDVIVHNECFADTADPDYIRKITAAHKGGVPAVVIHCAMHTYRAAAIDDWREFLGVTSRRHDHQSTYTVRRTADGHPALGQFPAQWVSPKDELYIIDKLWPNARALAVSKSEKDGNEHPVIWVNDYSGTRVFGTTFGHGNATWQDPVFLKLVASGLLWAAGR